MAITRRTFLHRACVAAAALAVDPGRALAAPRRPAAELDPATLTPFVDPLPLPPIARPAGTWQHDGRRLPHYRIPMRQVLAKVHRDLPPTRFWSYGSGVPGPTLEVRRGEGVRVDWINRLPARHFLPIDHTLAGAHRDEPDVRAVVHLHGGKVPPASDGYPDAWCVPGQSLHYFYPNEQDAATLWYHDHAMGIHRLNVFAGLMGLYLIRDAAEDALDLPKGRYEIPLIICDRSFRTDGQLYYPTSGEPGAPWIPEYFGNVLLINGALFPRLDVEPCRYRFRVLNGSNSRFLFLSLPEDVPIHQIGTDQGLLEAPIEVTSLHLAPAERADLVIDFRRHAGCRVVLRNEVSDVMQFRVAAGPAGAAGGLPARLRDIVRLRPADAVRTRTLKLGEIDSVAGVPLRMLLNDTRWSAPVTERPVLDTTEIWELANITDDAHPIHLHLVRFQILDRRPFDVFAYRTGRSLRYLGPSVPPDPSEAGWKDTVRAAPGMVTRIIVRFEGYAGRYVWHCHVLEHADNEMMRPYDVRPAAG